MSSYKYKARRDYAREYAEHKAERYKYKDFIREYGDNDALLQMLWDWQYCDMNICPVCNTEAKYYRITGRTQYACAACGNHITPLKNTPFYRSHISLSMWFYAIYLFSINKNGLSAKELERTLGVEYRTAYRMLNKIRALVAEGNRDRYFTSGTTEIDDSYFGGKLTNKHAKEIEAIKENRGGKGITGRSAVNKTVAIGAVNRESRQAQVEVLPSKAPNRVNTDKFIADTLDKHTNKVITDDYSSYMNLHERGVDHSVVEHSKGQYVHGSVHTNSVENLWSNIKRSLDGTYRGVSKKYLQTYLDEFVFRYNHRGQRVFFAVLALLDRQPSAQTEDQSV